MEFVHILQSANAMANELAKQGVNRSSCFVVLPTVASFGGFGSSSISMFRLVPTLAGWSCTPLFLL